MPSAAQGADRASSPQPEPSASREPPESDPFERITFADIERADLFGAGCSFHRPGEDQPIAILQAERAAVRQDDEIMLLTPDRTSGALELGALSAYVGDGLSLRIERLDRAYVQSGYEVVSWPATMAVAASGRANMRIPGTLSCGS